MRDRMAAVGEMAALMAHEIKNPLASISGSAQMLTSSSAASTPRAPAAPHRRRRVDAGCRRSSTSSSTTPAPTRRPTSREHRGDAARRHGPAAALGGDDQPSRAVRLEPGRADRLHGEEHLLRQLFWNLSRNAIQAMPDGGLLRVQLARQRQGSGAVLFRDQGRGHGPRAAAAAVRAVPQQQAHSGTLRPGTGARVTVWCASTAATSRCAAFPSKGRRCRCGCRRADAVGGDVREPAGRGVAGCRAA